MNDKDFWLIVRRALLMVVRAIEKRYKLNEMKVVEIGDTDTISALPFSKE